MPPLEEPIRAELFGIERLEQHAESLAAAQPSCARGRRAVDCCRGSRTPDAYCLYLQASKA
jgi:hypothetical protein